MPQKSIEQYERELMEMYRLALAKDPNYASLAQRHSTATVDESISEDEIVVTIPAPSVEEAVPLPRGIIPAMPQETTVPAAPRLTAEAAMPQAALPAGPVEPSAVAVVLPVTERAPRLDSSSQVRAGTPAGTVTEVDIVTETDIVAQANPEVGVSTDAQIAPDSEAGVDTATGSETTVPSAPGRPAAPSTAAETQRMAATPNLGAGNLIVNVTTQKRTRPVANAVVIVSHPDESGNKVAARVVTDSSGKTELIRLPAPIREIPVYPQPMTGGDLSAKYLVEVEAPGFESVSGEEISIFDGVTSVKRIDLMAEAGAGRTASGSVAESRGNAQRE